MPAALQVLTLPIRYGRQLRDLQCTYYAVLGQYAARSGEEVINEEGEVRDITFITRKLIANVMPLKVSDSALSAIT